MVEKNALEDEQVKEAIKKLELPEGAAVCADPWIYGKLPQSSHRVVEGFCMLTQVSNIGSDGVNDDERMYQVFLYMRDPNNASELDCKYALGLYSVIVPFISAIPNSILSLKISF
jgi:primary-amine oxidase